MKKSHRSHGLTFSCNRPALAGYVVFIYMDPSVFVQRIGEIPVWDTRFFVCARMGNNN
jgi:hypothetical protein